MHKKYKIAGLNVFIKSCYNEEFFTKRYAAYVSDFKDEEADFTLESKIRENMEYPVGGEILLDTPGTKLYRMPDSNFIQLKIRSKDNYIVEKFTFTSDWKHCSIELAELPKCRLSVQDREYMFTFEAFVARVCYLGGVMIHSSCISYKGNAVLFSANSGTGKSTHTTIWKKVFKDDVEFINDDKPIVWLENGVPYAYGTPWSGKTDLNNNLRCPVKAIVFVERGQRNEIEEVGIKDILFTLFSNIIIPIEDKALAKRVLQVYNKILANTKIYRLRCNMDDEAAIVSRDGIFGGK